MALENVSADYLSQVLEQVEESAASERLMAAITYKEFDDVTQEDAAELYGYSEGGFEVVIPDSEVFDGLRDRVGSSQYTVFEDDDGIAVVGPDDIEVRFRVEP